MGSGKMLASLPMAVAIALSPFAIIPAIVLLLTPRPRPTAGAFLVGWVLGVALVVILAVAVLDLRDAYAATPRWAAWARLLLGATFLVLAIVRWGRRGGPAPAWLQSVQTATPWHALGLGLTLSVANPKVMLLAVAGGGAIASAIPAHMQQALAVLAFTGVSSLGVALPWFAFLAAEEQAMPLLVRLRTWLEANADAVLAIVLGVLGTLLVVEGIRLL